MKCIEVFLLLCLVFSCDAQSTSLAFTECCVGSPGQSECGTERLELTEGGSEAVLCAVFTGDVGSDEDQPMFSVSIEPQGIRDVRVKGEMVGGTADGRRVFQPCVSLEAVNDNVIEQTEDYDIIFNASFPGTFGTCSVQIIDNDDAMVSCRGDPFVGNESDGFVETCGTITLAGEVEVSTLRVVVDDRTIIGDMFEDDNSSSTNEDSGVRFVFCTNVTLTPGQLERLRITIRLEADNGTGTFTEVSTDTCRASIGTPPPTVPTSATPSETLPPTDPTSAPSESLSLGTIVGATVGGVVAVVLLLVVILGIALCCRRESSYTVKKRDVERSVQEGSIGGYVDTTPNKTRRYKKPERVSELIYEEVSDEQDRRNVSVSQFNVANIEKWRDVFTGMMLKPSQIEFQKPVGEGAFGRVFKGKIVKSSSGLSSVSYTQVAIKTLKKVSSDQEVEDFIAESAIMLDFHHPNVLSLVGVCFDTEDQLPIILLPFMANGDLRAYLKSQRRLRASSKDFPEGLSENVLMRICLDIARGLEYLAALKFVHRDIAARNCMVDEALRVKVADFGMSRDVFHSDYYRLTHKARLPVKWMPPESLFDNIFNEKTDVWSFGVTCWEVFSIGHKPFTDIDNVEIPDYISNGNRLQKPVLCSDEMFTLMRSTWNESPKDRPTFAQLVKSLFNQHGAGSNHHYHPVQDSGSTMYNNSRPGHTVPREYEIPLSSSSTQLLKTSNAGIAVEYETPLSAINRSSLVDPYYSSVPKEE